MSDSCRLIIDDAAGGVHNMSVDEALLESTTETGRPTLRFYQWTPATLSLGYFQRLEDRRLHEHSRDCPFVRRASGGGAIVHDHELTYCFAAAAGVRSSAAPRMYDAFHGTLIDVLADLGIAAQLHGQTWREADGEFLCFRRRASGDVTLGEHKIAGSAQRRRRNALVQHGSVLLRRSRHAPELPGLRDLANWDLGVDALVGPWLAKLADRLELTFRDGQLSVKESDRARGIAAEKFSQQTWNGRR